MLRLVHTTMQSSLTSYKAIVSLSSRVAVLVASRRAGTAQLRQSKLAVRFKAKLGVFRALPLWE